MNSPKSSDGRGGQMRESMTARELAEDLDCNAIPVTAEKPTVKIKKEVYLVLYRGLHYVVEGDICSCGHERVVDDDDPHIPAELAYECRYWASCSHQKIVMKADDIEPCSACGCYVADREKLFEAGRWVMTRWTCSECGTERYA